MSARKISPDLEKELLARAGSGMTSRAIAEWLNNEHGIAISSAAVRKRLAQTREERSDVAKAVAREALAPVILSDLDVLQVERDRLLEMAGTLFGVDHELYLKTIDRLRAFIETRMKFAGVAGGNDDLENLSDDKLRELARKAVRVLGEGS